MQRVGRQSQRREAAEAEASFSNFRETHKLAGGWGSGGGRRNASVRFL